MKRKFILFLLPFLVSGVMAQDPVQVKYAQEISNETAYKHLSVLTSDEFAGRRSGAEIVLFIPGGAPADALIWGRDLVGELQSVCEEFTGPVGESAKRLTVHAGVASVADVRSVRDLLEAADGALRRAQMDGFSNCELSSHDGNDVHGAEDWRRFLEIALAFKFLSIADQAFHRASARSCGVKD